MAIDTAEIEPVRRIYGIEDEFGTKQYSKLEKHGGMLDLQKYVPEASQVREYLGNGARVYLDIGDHVEYATPECLSIRELVASNIAGQELLARYMHAFNASLVDVRPDDKPQLNARVIDDEGKTWGSHENYLTRRDIDPKDEAKMAFLATHLVTRVILTGAGVFISREDGRPEFQISQKQVDVEAVTNDQTGRNKPLINTRDEPHANQHNFRRLHVVSGETTISPWATAIRIGSTSLALRLIEHPDIVDVSDCILEDPVTSIRASLHNRDAAVETTTGERLNFAQLQQRIVERLRVLTDRISVPKDELIVLDEWERGISDYIEDPGLLFGRADWATKEQIAENQESREDKGSKAKKLRSVDMSWGALSPGGLGRHLRQRGIFHDPLHSLELVGLLTHCAPQGRADIRGNAVRRLAHSRKAQKQKSSFTISWTHLKRGEENIATFYDPYGENQAEARRLRLFVNKYT